MTDQNRQSGSCQRCGRPIARLGGDGPDRDLDVFCSQCLIEEAEKYIGNEPVEKPEAPRMMKAGKWKIAIIIIIMAFTGVMTYQVWKVKTAHREAKPARMGSYETDERTDQCIRNLSKIADLMRKGPPDPAGAFVCPVSGEPYRISSDHGLEIRCPNPESHGFREILITKETRIPQLRK